MKLLVLGATGPCGILTCQYALQAGHKLVVYVRNPNKLPKDIATHDDVQVVGGQLTDLPSLRSALSGCNAVISSLGPMAPRDPETYIANGYKVVLEAMRAEGITRLVAIGTPSILDQFDIPTWTLWLARLLISTFAPGAYKDILACGDLISQAGDLDWTIVRVPFLTTSPGRSYVVGYVGDGKVGWLLRREAYAQFVMDELENGDWIKKMPVISNA
ncbi:NAD-binding protein [Rhizoctonia solani]|nr:NAD-binding protein [Rhizoctonia solani]